MEKSKKAIVNQNILSLGKKWRNYHALKMSLTQSAYQVLKKEVEKQKNLLIGVKFEQIPRILSVDRAYTLELF